MYCSIAMQRSMKKKSWVLESKLKLCTSKLSQVLSYAFSKRNLAFVKNKYRGELFGHLQGGC